MFSTNYTYIDVPSLVPQTLKQLMKMKWIGFDTETDSLDPHTGNLILIQLGNEKEQFIYDCRKVHPSLLRPILEGRKAKVGTFLQFDYSFSKKYGIEPEPLFDITINERILLAGKVYMQARNHFSLAALSKKYLDYEVRKELQTSFSLRGKIDKQQKKYAALDVILPVLILQEQVPLLELEGLIQTAKLENSAIPAFADMRYNGFFLNKEAWEDLSRRVENALKGVESRLNIIFSKVVPIDLFGKPIINYNSPEQMLFALQKMGFNISNTNSETLRFLPDQELSSLLLEHRSLSKAIGSFGANYLEFINEKTGRIHPEINQIGASTGRSSVEKPNLQQQIRKQVGSGISGSEYRRAWSAQSDDGLLITADFSAQELRTIAEISKEPSWVNSFILNKDLHAVTALDIFGMEVSKKKNPEIRTIMKEINFGSAYGMNAWKLIQLFKKAGKEIPIEEAESIMQRYYEAYPKVKKVLDDISIQAIEFGYVETLNGRKRYFSPPPFKMVYSKRQNKMIPVPTQYGNREHTQKLNSIMREGRNMRIQGTGGDILKLSMVYIRNKLKKNKMGRKLLLVNQVHDEIVTEITGKTSKEEAVFLAKEFIEKPMLEAEAYFLKSIPPAIEYTIGKEWVK